MNIDNLFDCEFPPELRTTTLTVCGKIDKNINFDFDIMFNKFGNSKFFNQVSIKIKRKNIKLFKNNSIQITGCKTKKNIIHCFERLLKIIKIYCLNKLNFNINSFYDIKISMIHVNFSFPFNIDKNKLYNQLITNFPYYNCYLDDGIKIKHNNLTTIIYDSGYVKIIGSNTFSEILQFYNLLNIFILKKYFIIKYV